MTKSERGAHVPKNVKNIRVRTRADGSIRGYEVRYRDPLKRDSRGYPAVRGKVLPTLAEAREWQLRNSVEILDGDYVDADRLKTKWREVADEWLDVRRVKLRARTISGYENVLKNWLSEWDDKTIGSITTRDVRAIIRKVRAAGRAVGTEHHVYDTLNGVLKFAVRDGYIKKNPAATVREDLRGTAEKDYVGQALTIEQAEAIVAALPEGRFRMYGLVGLWTGMRAGELAGLRVRNINFDKLTIQVDETVEDVKGHLRPGTTKTRKSKGRRIPVPSAIIVEIAEFIEGAGLAGDDYVFAVPGKLFSHANFYDRQWQPACAEAGLAGTRFHTLRHTFITLRAREGVPVHLLMAWAGHSNISTTMIYTHVFEDDPNDHGVAERIFSAERREVIKPELRLVEVQAG
ncbi:tyrosine-type recombinase/integrase [Aeromicrobium fastidiosum]|uniref:Site-specific integrase n=1 Tax=Aeromicrobium fastidiosum TaxID=52699 RepID=A0A641AMP2_9ACTN|nr:site-specific integrase [Aeromicrobium fastidiosum]KAA1378544.1 site-specific integrase [Aeromicrobium fastidiosum]MBP2392487.1 integrase [Aeromicrobium fastidiosum]